MGSYIIKPDRDADFYVRWSTIVDNWTFAGTRAEVAEYLREEYGRAGERLSAEALDMADSHGSSSRRGNGRWDDRVLIVADPEGRGVFELRRADLRRYVEGDESALTPEESTTP